MKNLLIRRPARIPRVLIGSGALLLALAGVTACASSGGGNTSSGSADSSAKAPYTVDIISSLTGADSSGGVPEYDAYKTVIGYVNAHGGVNGRKIKILHAYDDQSSPTTANSATCG